MLYTHVIIIQIFNTLLAIEEINRWWTIVISLNVLYGITGLYSKLTKRNENSSKEISCGEGGHVFGLSEIYYFRSTYWPC